MASGNESKWSRIRGRALTVLGGVGGLVVGGTPYSALIGGVMGWLSGRALRASSDV